MRFILRWLIALAVPLVLVMAVVRVVTMPWYPAWEYRKASFSDDPLGMPDAERLRLARASIRFLNVQRGSELLDDLAFADGTAAYNEREISHMDDVKLVYDRLTSIALLAICVALVSMWGLAKVADNAAIWGAFSDGSLLTLCLLVGLGAWMLVGFNAFFTAFHGVFFEGGSWLFSYDDTLIRLFPLKFWQDAGMLIAAVVGVIAFALALFSRAWQKRLERERNAAPA